MKVSSKNIRSIMPGTSKTFKVAHPRDIDVAKALAYRLNSLEPEAKKRYSCKADFANRKITITAEAL